MNHRIALVSRRQGSLCVNKTLCDGMSSFNKEKIIEFDVLGCEKKMRGIYAKVLGE